jgi:hypothetical protein
VAQPQSVRAARGDHADQAVGLSPSKLPSLVVAAAGAPQVAIACTFQGPKQHRGSVVETCLSHRHGHHSR